MSDWGYRPDGTKKGPGFLGTLLRPDGAVSTELSMGTEDLDGRERDIPALVPTLTNDEIRYLLSAPPGDWQNPTMQRIAGKAVDYARERMHRGQSVFAPSLQMSRTGAPRSAVGELDFQEALARAIRVLAGSR